MENLKKNTIEYKIVVNAFIIVLSNREKLPLINISQETGVYISTVRKVHKDDDNFKTYYQLHRYFVNIYFSNL